MTWDQVFARTAPRALARSRWAKVKPLRSRTAGSRRWPISTPSSANGPSPARRTKPGTATGSDGRCSVLARVFVNSRFVTGAGPTRLTGPETSAVSRWRIAATSSGRLIQLTHWRPLPSGAPRPALKIGSWGASAPPAAGQDDAGAQVRHAHPGLLGRLGRPLPRAAGVGEEALALGALLVRDAVGGVPVDADGARGQEHSRPGRVRDRGQGLRHRRRPVDPAGEDLLLVGRGPALVGHAGAGEVDDRVEVLDRRRGELPRRRVPRPLVRSAGGPADEAHHLVAVPAQGGDEGLADQT